MPGVGDVPGDTSNLVPNAQLSIHPPPLNQREGLDSWGAAEGRDPGGLDIAWLGQCLADDYHPPAPRGPSSRPLTSTFRGSYNKYTQIASTP